METKADRKITKWGVKKNTKDGAKNSKFEIKRLLLKKEYGIIWILEKIHMVVTNLKHRHAQK